jgi:aminoglycoside phosphotransferase (APT) family kinase protein
MLTEPASETNSQPPCASAPDSDAVSKQLLEYLRAKFHAPELCYAQVPHRLTGGFENTVLSFSLDRPIAALCGPAVLRIFKTPLKSDRTLYEATIQNAIAEMGYPAPRVLLAENDAGILGGAFIVMERKSGDTLASGSEGLVSGLSARGLFKLVAGSAGMVRRNTRLLADAQHRLHQLPVEPLVRALEERGLSVEPITFEGRLKWLRSLTEQLELKRLRSGVAWLDSHRATQPRRLSICHCDIQPLNILVENGRVTGVLDWGNVTLGDCAMDLGATLANFATVPLNVPRSVHATFRLFLNFCGRYYYRVYCRLSPLDAFSTRYYQVFRCMLQLVAVAGGISSSRLSRDIFDSPKGIANLISHIHKLTGLKLRFDRDEIRSRTS